MRGRYRITGTLLVMVVLHLSVLPCLWAADDQFAATKKVTTNDPLFIPLSEEQAIRKGLAWYWYVLGVAAIAGVAAAVGGGSSSAAASTGSVTGSW